ncbi:MAG: serine/threonine protein kinase [Phycisphaeraceae bacterium]|nr:MAG: serine/threonine protein kinase [Phycisphaeraceae bacterium]
MESTEEPVMPDRVESIFHEARALPPDQRSAYLTSACGEDLALRSKVDAMLSAAEETADSLRATEDDATITRFALAPPRVQSERLGQQIGRYKLLELLGEGGFGTVWAAEQREPVRRRVALKIIKLGMDTKQVIARFEAERQALAMMDHPNIAKVLDAGATETGRPFFAMELVKGVPIIEYCDREKLDTRARLGLFMKVCHAIQHAHQKGVIHRDIKPSNVLVTLHDGRPAPKVIDFGIAKATNQELTEKTIYTQHRQMIGTPAYMSPEQAEMSGLDIDTRSDVYSLGVLLYEMLTGTTPFSHEELNSAGFEGMMKLIREVEPHKPSTRLSSMGVTATQAAERRRADIQKLGMMLRGDLDWIVMKCLEKDRTRRYDTASGLAADIQRHLSDEPVLARPPSTSYRLLKFVKRNKGQVLAGGAIAALLALGLFGTGFGLVWALDEKQRADEQASAAMAAAESERIAKLEAVENERRAIGEAERAEAAEAEALARAAELELVAQFQAGQLSAIEPEAMGANLRRSLLDAAPEAERDALAAALAPINFTNIALSTLKDNIFERTITAIDTQFESQPLVRARLLQTVAETLRALGLFDLATDPQERALAIRREQLGDEHPDTLSSIHDLGALLWSKGKLVEAEPYFREALEGYQRVLGDDHPSTLLNLNSMGGLLQAQGRLAESEMYFREALGVYRRVLSDDNPNMLISINNMGILLQAQGKLAEAEPYYREALEGLRRVLGDEHPRTLGAINNMGFLLQAQGKLAEAEPYYREALEVRRRVLGDDHPSTLTSINNMGGLLRNLGRLEEADTLGDEAVRIARDVLGAEHWIFGMFRMAHARTLAAMNRYVDAEERALEAYAVLSAALGENHERLQEAARAITDIYTAWHVADPDAGHDAKAEEWRAKLEPAP